MNISDDFMNKLNGIKTDNSCCLFYYKHVHILLISTTTFYIGSNKITFIIKMTFSQFQHTVNKAHT